MASRPVAVYRRLLRSIHKAFRNDDEMLSKAGQEVRSRYQYMGRYEYGLADHVQRWSPGEDASVADAWQGAQAAAGEADPTEVARLCAEGEEAADFIRTYVVQARLNERGNYEMQVEEHHADTVAEEAALRPPRR